MAMPTNMLTFFSWSGQLITLAQSRVVVVAQHLAVMLYQFYSYAFVLNLCLFL